MGNHHGGAPEKLPRVDEILLSKDARDVWTEIRRGLQAFHGGGTMAIRNFRREQGMPDGRTKITFFPHTLMEAAIVLPAKPSNGVLRMDHTQVVEVSACQTLCLGAGSAQGLECYLYVYRYTHWEYRAGRGY